MSNTTTSRTTADREAARAKRIARATLIEDVTDAKVMLQDARDNGITIADANSLRDLIESIISATISEDKSEDEYLNNTIAAALAE